MKCRKQKCDLVTMEIIKSLIESLQLSEIAQCLTAAEAWLYFSGVMCPACIHSAITCLTLYASLTMNQDPDVLMKRATANAG